MNPRTSTLRDSLIRANSVRRHAEALPIDFQSRGDRDYEVSGLIEAALEAAQFRQTAAAEMLGLSYHQLRGLLKKYSLPRADK